MASTPEAARPGDAGADTLALIAELEQAALDPTLDQCCRRDLHEQIQRERVRHTLQREDRVDARQRLAREAVCRDAAGLPRADPGQQQPEQQQQQHAGGGDAELEALRQQRLRQLQAQSAAQQEQRREGFGTLNTVQEGGVLALVREPPGQGLLVLHLTVQGHEPCNSLDEVLEAAAGQHRGTYFARCVVSRRSPLAAELQLPHGLPALLVGRDGALLGKAPLSQFGGADIWGEEVLAYLRRFKVLAGAGGSAAAGASGDSSDTGSASDAEAGEWQAPCEVCGRTYAHEHIRAIYSRARPRSDDESDED